MAAGFDGHHGGVVQRRRGSELRPAPVSPFLVEARRLGYLILDSVPGPAGADRLERRMRDLMVERAADVDASGGTVYVPNLQDDDELRSVLQHPKLVTTLAYLLGAEPKLQSARFRSPRSGAGAQALHRDQPWPDPDGRWTAATVIIGLVEFTSANGATRLVPGTHLDRVPFTPRSVRYHHPDEITLTGPPGAAYVFTGACLHSGTINDTAAERPGIQAMFGRRAAL
jgi:Phytanoyl-CoA dioxygenase (PhyH)